jgi:hypothetical protein
MEGFVELAAGFAYNPINPTPDQPDPPRTDLGLLAQLPGTWAGKGFNAIWRPSHVTQDRFLELNVTNETIEFTAIPGDIPNRGLLQDDLKMTGVRYLQQIADANIKDANGNDSGLHIEPGLWLSVPATTDPNVQSTVARLASIPHGTSIVAQGTAFTVNGPPVISPVNLNPFPTGNPAGAFTFPEQDLTVTTAFRTPADGLVGVTQDMINNPNSVIASLAAAQTITSTAVLQVTTSNTPILGGGIANTAFLEGSTDGPNADAALVTATFWIEMVEGSDQPQLQYTQTVLLNFNRLSWPHITVATLTKQT